MSKTTRTDAKVAELSDDECTKNYPAELLKHARTLERELATVTAERDALLKDSKRLDWLEDVAADFDFKRLARHGNIRAYVDAAKEVR